jgi:hypothetical protein
MPSVCICSSSLHSLAPLYLRTRVAKCLLMQRDIRRVGVSVITVSRGERYPEVEFAPLADGSMPLSQPLLSASPVSMISMLSHRLDQADASRGVRNAMGDFFTPFEQCRKLICSAVSPRTHVRMSKQGPAKEVWSALKKTTSSFFSCTGRSQRLQDVV